MILKPQVNNKNKFLWGIVAKSDTNHCPSFSYNQSMHCKVNFRGVHGHYLFSYRECINNWLRDWCDFLPLRIYHFHDIQYHFPDQLVLNQCQTICLTEDSSFQKNNHGNWDFSEFARCRANQYQMFVNFCIHSWMMSCIHHLPTYCQRFSINWTYCFHDHVVLPLCKAREKTNAWNEEQ